MITLGSAFLWLGALILSIVSFLFGKVFSQSEKILDQKRRAYETFLSVCPAPNEAHRDIEVDDIKLQRALGVLSLYGSEKSLKYASEYFHKFAEAQEVLVDVKESGHEKFIEVMSYYNRMAWEMRNDVMTWSVFAPHRKSREFTQGTFSKDKRSTK